MRTQRTRSWIFILSLLFAVLILTSGINAADDVEEAVNEQETVEQENISSSAPATGPSTEAQCDPNIPNLSVGDFFIYSAKELIEFRKEHKLYLMSVSSSKCEKCCLGEIILAQVHDAFKNKEVVNKGQQIPIVRVDYHNFTGSLEDVENADFGRVPKLLLNYKGVTYPYSETMIKEIILHFVNRHLYPVVLLKTEEAVNRFANTDEEWEEDTPFYTHQYKGYGQYFPLFKKVTRVIALVNDKKDFKDELKNLNSAAVTLADRDDLRVAKVTDPKLVKIFKNKYESQWFSPTSSNSVVFLKKESSKKDQIVHYYDLSTETLDMTNWISEKSLEPLEELSGITFRVVTQIKKPMFIAFIDRNHPEYAKESVELHGVLTEVAKMYPQFIFTFTEEDRFRNSKKDLKITWDEEPSIALNHMVSEDVTPFPRGKPFTKNNLIKFINGIIDGSIASKKFKLPDSYKTYLSNLKYVKKVKADKFQDVCFDKSKDVAVLFYNSESMDANSEESAKSFGKAASRFRDLKVKTVLMVAFDTAKSTAPEGFDVSSLPKAFILPAEHKTVTDIEISNLKAEDIMREIETNADIEFSLPNYPHLTEEEFRAFETRGHVEDL